MPLRRALLALAWSTLLAGLAIDGLQAQSDATNAPRTERRIARRYLFAAIGFTTGAVLAGAYAAAEKPNTPESTCSSARCVATVALLTSTIVGYMIGREFDQLHALRYRGGAPLSPEMTSVSLLGEPSLLATRDSTVAVGGPGGIQLFTSSRSLRPAGRGAANVRGIEALDLAPRDLIRRARLKEKLPRALDELAIAPKAQILCGTHHRRRIHSHLTRELIDRQKDRRP